MLKDTYKSSERRIEHTYKIRYKVKLLLEDLGEKIALEINVVRRENEDFVNDPKYILLNNSLATYLKLAKAKKSLHEVEKDFANPLKIALTEKYKLDEFSEHLTVIAKKAAVRLNDIKENSLHFVKQCKSLKEELEERIQNIEQKSKKIEEVVLKYKTEFEG